MTNEVYVDKTEGYLDAQISTIAQRVLDRHKGWLNDKDDARDITLWADLLEQKMIKAGNEWMVNQISRTITDFLRRNGDKLADHVNDFLPNKYKDPSEQRFGPNDPIEASTVTWHPASAKEALKAIEESSKYLEQNPPKDPEELREGYELTEKANDNFRKECDKQRVPLVHMNSWGEPMQSEEEQRTVSIVKPKPMITIAYEEVVAYGKAVLDYAETLRQFPPELEADIQFIARGFRVQREFLQPSLDLKWSKSYGGWLKIEKDRLDYGKHAAAVKNYTTTNVCAMCSNLHKDANNKVEPTVVELVRDAESSTGWKCPSCGCESGLKRNMTREQVGDKSPIILKFAWKIAQTWPGFQEAIYHHLQYIERRCGFRKRDLSPILSDRA